MLLISVTFFKFNKDGVLLVSGGYQQVWSLHNIKFCFWSLKVVDRLDTHGHSVRKSSHQVVI